MASRAQSLNVSKAREMSTTDTPEQRDIELELGISPTEDCPVRSHGAAITDVKHYAHRQGLQCDIYYRDPETGTEEVFHTLRAFSDPCPATIFHDHDCIPQVQEIEAGRFRVRTRLPDREAISLLLADLGKVAESVTVLRVSISGLGSTDDVRTVDLRPLTDKQREAIELAVEEGYYDQPKGITVSELATKLALSQSAMSQRLHTAERKLVEQLFDR